MLNNWRDDPGLSSQIEYRKRFAILPIKCSAGESLWFKSYYSKYKHWGRSHIGNESDRECYSHTDFIENITEAEFIIRKLSENL